MKIFSETIQTRPLYLVALFFRDRACCAVASFSSSPGLQAVKMLARWLHQRAQRLKQPFDPNVHTPTSLSLDKITKMNKWTTNSLFVFSLFVNNQFSLRVNPIPYPNAGRSPPPNGRLAGAGGVPPRGNRICSASGLDFIPLHTEGIYAWRKQSCVCACVCVLEVLWIRELALIFF